MSKLTHELFLNSQNVEFYIERTQEINGHIDYELIVRIGNLERFVYKRFNEIYEFNHSLAGMLPQIQLPYFPSKFQVLNKVETRKEKLYAYFNKLIEIANQKAFEDIGQTIKMKLAEFLRLDTAQRKSSVISGLNGKSSFHQASIQSQVEVKMPHEQI